MEGAGDGAGSGKGWRWGEGRGMEEEGGCGHQTADPMDTAVSGTRHDQYVFCQTCLDGLFHAEYSC